MLSSSLPLSRGPPLGCRAEIRTRACLTASRRVTVCATPHPMFVPRRTLSATPHPKVPRRTLILITKFLLSETLPLFRKSQIHVLNSSLNNGKTRKESNLYSKDRSSLVISSNLWLAPKYEAGTNPPPLPPSPWSEE